MLSEERGHGDDPSSRCLLMEVIFSWTVIREDMARITCFSVGHFQFVPITDWLSVAFFFHREMAVLSTTCYCPLEALAN